MYRSIFLFFVSVSLASANTGVDAVLARRMRMTPTVTPIAQRMENGAILSVYADDSVKTQAVRAVKMNRSTVAAVSNQLEDAHILASAKVLAGKIKTNHKSKVAGLSDADVIASAESVFDSNTKTSTASLIAALLGEGAVAVANKKGKSK